MNWLRTLCLDSRVPRWAGILCLIGLGQLSLVPGQATEQSDTVPGEKGGWKLDLFGTLAIGQFTYTVSGSLVQVAAKVEELDLSVSSGQSVVASIRVYSLPGDRLEMIYADQTYPLPAELASAWAGFLSLTPADLENTKEFRSIARESGRSWESVTPVTIRHGFPAKVRFIYVEKSEDAQQETSCPSEVVLWSLEEWNNCFDQNVVLRLNFLKEASHDH